MHDEHSRSRSEHWLARQLRDAARRQQPEFSESLHQRVMQAVRPPEAERICAEPALSAKARIGFPRRRAYWKSAALLTAAVAILAMVIAGRRSADSSNPEIRGDSQPQATVAVHPASDANANSIVNAGSSTAVKSLPADVESNAVASSPGDYTLDDLSRDARATAHLLVDQLPFETPTEDWGL
jgi:anti-sigma-K factor RskA